MLPILSFAILALISYCLGCGSSAKLITKTFKNINIYKVGTGHPDTQNIYHNIDKILGIFVGIVDMGKMYFYLIFLKYFLTSELVKTSLQSNIGSQNHLLILGFVLIIGHCLPITHHFKGGRGLFTYIGFVLFFAPEAMVIISILALLIVIFFKQIRFAQYMIVLLPPFINFFFEHDSIFLAKMFLAAILMGIINFIVSKRLGEI